MRMLNDWLTYWNECLQMIDETFIRHNFFNMLKSFRRTGHIETDVNVHKRIHTNSTSMDDEHTQASLTIVVHSVLILREIPERGGRCIDQISDYRICAWKKTSCTLEIEFWGTYNLFTLKKLTCIKIKETPVTRMWSYNSKKYVASRKWFK